MKYKEVKTEDGVNDCHVCCFALACIDVCRLKTVIIMKKYYKNKREAIQECARRNMYKSFEYYKVFKMPKGTRHHGEYAVCSEMEYLNTY